jgi:secreted Zn-dependent insulinase-like peptidase
VVNYYCELNSALQTHLAGVYLISVDRDGEGSFENQKLASLSDRVWKESEHGTYYLKRKSQDFKAAKKLTGEELKEFMWVKLKAEKLK